MELFVIKMQGLAVDLQLLRMERSISACFFKISIFPIFFSNATSIQISLQSLTIDFIYI